jgi:hypothetical protein
VYLLADVRNPALVIAPVHYARQSGELAGSSVHKDTHDFLMPMKLRKVIGCLPVVVDVVDIYHLEPPYLFALHLYFSIICAYMCLYSKQLMVYFESFGGSTYVLF